MARLTSRAPALVVFLVYSSLHALAIATFLPRPILLNHLLPGLANHPVLSGLPSVNDQAMPPLPYTTPSPVSNTQHNNTRHRNPNHMTRVAQAHEFLHEHNKIRAEVGEPPLVWDKKLARYALRYANKRKADCALVHSPGDEFGENIYWGKHFERHSATTAVRNWVSETQYYNKGTHSCAANQMCGHFTQIIWRNTKRVGCARVKCESGGVFTVCEYDPPGNYQNEDPLTSID